MRKLLLLSLLAMVSIFVHAGENDLCWDYTNTDIPSAGPDNGWYYAGSDRKKKTSISYGDGF